MNQFAAQWQDTDKNRLVDFTVTYQVENSNIEIENITPTRVSFLAPPQSIGVHTLKGQTMLAAQIKNAGAYEIAIQQIAEKHGLLAAL